MDDSSHDRTREQTAGPADAVAPPVGVPELARPGDALRSLPSEARQRGTSLVSARAMQARLFSVYDAAAAAEEALALVQEQLTLTLNRSYYEEDEIESTASRLDELLNPPLPMLPSATGPSATTPGAEAPSAEASPAEASGADASPAETPDAEAGNLVETSETPERWDDYKEVDPDADTAGGPSLTE